MTIDALTDVLFLTSGDLSFLGWCVVLMLGLVVGSFLSVALYRLPIVWKLPGHASLEAQCGLYHPPSHCPNCMTHLKWRHMVPLLSFIALKGRCASCGIKIAWIYPLLELACALLFALSVQCMGMGWEILSAWVFCSVTLLLMALDIRHKILPDVLTLGLLWAGLLQAAFSTEGHPGDAIVGAAVGYGFCWLVGAWFLKWRRKIGLGRGDYKLAAALGAWLGWALLPQLLLVAAGMALLGIITQWRVYGNKIMSMRFAFGPYLGTAGIIMLFAGQSVLSGYLSWLGLD